ncbi:unnamed protein product (macronuclear) [Paramecium tetraurelia]|uniref:Uncharacterized protein n=1 Tax=Paramecium tetraurelia TaxID=5888 RepID=A0D961_PARTE|nr:uncharacterized protein GSPATT00014524001 [Paramecium tetraurelia]CAK79578.1 unnamed protein product [Paramecium tetraurelia]|eukprot:XP_001446975.1 hypothetical protein (macronuclear) [Paramecium tetraurelia strain d4-2]
MGSICQQGQKSSNEKEIQIEIQFTNSKDKLDANHKTANNLYNCQSTRQLTFRNEFASKFISLSQSSDSEPNQDNDPVDKRTFFSNFQTFQAMPSQKSSRFVSPQFSFVADETSIENQFQNKVQTKQLE